MEAANHNFVQTGQMKQPNIPQVCEWVKNLW